MHGMQVHNACTNVTWVTLELSRWNETCTIEELGLCGIAKNIYLVFFYELIPQVLLNMLKMKWYLLNSEYCIIKVLAIKHIRVRKVTHS